MFDIKAMVIDYLISKPTQEYFMGSKKAYSGKPMAKKPAKKAKKK